MDISYGRKTTKKIHGKYSRGEVEKTNLEKMCAEYYEVVLRYLLTLTRDHDMAEELTQETFYRAIQKADTFRGDARMTTWLCQIAKFTFYQTIDKTHRHPTTSIEEYPVEIEDFRIPQPEAALIQGEQKVALYKAIQRLSSPTRDVVMLRITGELSFKEIGEILGKSENWARVTFYRGKQMVMKEVPQND
ncbi:MAG: sigma-70 family RNA polymerase sigma factor [Lachnospiraceae bacterium]|nr:sigma-70 family RNA polymerase sigma factor [Lachnospiraceae bacterium]